MELTHFPLFNSLFYEPYMFFLGPCGIRAAIECALLGAYVVLVEQRGDFFRNNVLHIWPFVIQDLKDIGIKVFYPKFCRGSIDHISKLFKKFFGLKNSSVLKPSLLKSPRSNG